jgi:hypothetical protein
VRRYITPRHVNLALAVAWAIMVPVSLWTGWVFSIAFTGLASIYANAATHWAGARADSPTPGIDL